ncbi:MAG: hypothetical protein MUC50_16195 [Myxococcota bacterium]|nr:hypothetical protein [Myxococcota bacterium]
MFWKLVGFLVRLIYFKRFRQANRLGCAARLIGDGRAEETLRLVDAERATLHADLRPLFHAVRARALEALDRGAEAHGEYIAAAAADPASQRAQLDLALSEASLGHLVRSMTRLQNIAEDAASDTALRNVANQAISRLHAICPDSSSSQNQ